MCGGWLAKGKQAASSAVARLAPAGPAAAAGQAARAGTGPAGGARRMSCPGARGCGDAHPSCFLASQH